MLRESLLIEAVAKRDGAIHQMDLMTLETQFAALMDPTFARDLLRRRMARAQWLTSLRQMDLMAREPTLMGAESMVKLYEAMEKSGILGEETDAEEVEEV